MALCQYFQLFLFTFLYVCMKNPFFQDFFSSFSFFLNQNCCELSQGPRIWKEVSCEIDIFLFKM